MSHGSSRLTEEQQQFYVDRFDARYLHVQERPFTVDEHGKPVARASRAERRRNRFRPRMEPR